jgi:hypothetical protein
VNDPLDQPEFDGYALVLPFVACQSHGGPYDDESFVAGFRAGQVDRALAVIAAVEGDGLAVQAESELVKQLDLIAMHRGFPATAVTDVGHGWVLWECAREIPAPREEST